MSELATTRTLPAHQSTAVGRVLALLAGVLSLAASVAPAQERNIGVQPTKGPAAVDSYANSWALVIGINAYKKVSPQLNYAVADATKIAEALPELGFPKQNVRVLLDGEATRAEILRSLYRGFPKMGRNDRMLVYFAGHGATVDVKDGEEGYLLPVDADPAALPETALLMEEMKGIGKRIDARHVLFVLDACFSGFSLQRDIAASGGLSQASWASWLREPVVQVITAGRKNQKAIEREGHGLFTRHLLSGLRLAGEGAPVLTATQLAAWVESRVVSDSNGAMTPQYGKLYGEGQFLFLRPGASLVSLPVPVTPPRPPVPGGDPTARPAVRPPAEPGAPARTIGLQLSYPEGAEIETMGRRFRIQAGLILNLAQGTTPFVLYLADGRGPIYGAFEVRVVDDETANFLFGRNAPIFRRQHIEAVLQGRPVQFTLGLDSSDNRRPVMVYRLTLRKRSE